MSPMPSAPILVPKSGTRRRMSLEPSARSPVLAPEKSRAWA
jgi:hypothetical protein